MVLFSLLFSQLLFAQASPAIQYVSTPSILSRQTASQCPSSPAPPSGIQLDRRLPVQTLSEHAGFANVNAKFGSRFDFSVFPQYGVVRSGTDGAFHENDASYIVGLVPAGQNKTFLFHMGHPNASAGDSYVSNEHWIEGLDTTRWVGDGGQGMHIIVDVIDTFLGEPGCTAIANCANAVKDDTVPVFILGISLQNAST